MKANSTLVSGMLKRLTFSAAFLVAGLVSAQTLRWDMPNEYGPKSVPGMADVHFSELVKSTTAGKLEVVNQFGGAINIRSKDMLDAISTGALMLGHFPIQAASGSNPLFLLSNLPAIAQTPEESIMLQDIARPHLEKVLATFDAEILYMTFFPPVGVWSKQPLTTVEAYRGRKLRTNDAISTEFFKKLGANTMQISWTDLLPQLQTGAVDSVHTSTSGGVLGQLWETLPVYNDVGTSLAVNIAIVNSTALKKLDPATRTALLNAGKQTETWARKKMIDTIAEEKKTIIAGGGKILGLSNMTPPLIDAFNAAGGPLVEDWLKKTGAPGKEVLDGFAIKANKKR